MYLYPLLPVLLKKLCCCPWYPSRTCAGNPKKNFAADAAKFCAPHGEPPSHTLVFGWSSVLFLRSVFNRRNRSQICFGDPNRGGALLKDHSQTRTISLHVVEVPATVERHRREKFTTANFTAAQWREIYYKQVSAAVSSSRFSERSSDITSLSGSVIVVGPCPHMYVWGLDVHTLKISVRSSRWFESKMWNSLSVSPGARIRVSRVQVVFGYIVLVSIWRSPSP